MAISGTSLENPIAGVRKYSHNPSIWLSSPGPARQCHCRLIHARLVTIHPFTDGNGRVARLLMNLQLLRTGYPLAIVQAVDRNAYIDAVVAWQAGSTEPLLWLIANRIKASAREILSLTDGEIL